MKRISTALLTCCALAIMSSSSMAAKAQPKTYQDITPTLYHAFSVVKEVIVDSAVGGCRVGLYNIDKKEMYVGDVMQGTASNSICHVFVDALGSQKKVVVWWDDEIIRGKKPPIIKRVNYLAE